VGTPEGILAGSSATFLRVTLVNYDEATHRFGPGQVFTYCPVCQREPAPLVTVGTNPQTLLTGPDGRIHVVCTGNFGGYEPAEWGQVRVLDWPTLGQQDTLRLGGTPDRAQVVGDMVYVSAFFGGLMKYDGRTHAVLRDSTPDPRRAGPRRHGLRRGPEAALRGRLRRRHDLRGRHHRRHAGDGLAGRRRPRGPGAG
jgi:hypothetical protein